MHSLDSLAARLPLSFKRRIRSVFDRQVVHLPVGRRAFLFLAADYGNIGDIAITGSQERFLYRYGGKPNVVVVPISKTRALLSSIREQATPDDLVTTVGGGNMGYLYPDIEELRQLVIRSFPRNRLVSFPQTLDWDESAASAKALERIVDAYSRHEDLHIFARETVSLDKLNQLFAGIEGVRIGLAPDMVLGATAADFAVNGAGGPRVGILLCMREDRERAVTESERKDLESALAGTGMDVRITDTHVGGLRLGRREAEDLVRDKIEQFRSARLVVTDRLHGMILSVVAGTPCLVLPNSNHKIHQTYHDWLSGNSSVRLVHPDAGPVLEEQAKDLLASEPPGPGHPCVHAESYADLQNALMAP